MLKLQDILFICMIAIFYHKHCLANVAHIPIKSNSDKPKTKFSTNNLLKNYLEHSSFKHKVFSDNIANVNTPGYKADDVLDITELDEISNTRNQQITLKTTSRLHFTKHSPKSINFNKHKLKDPYEVKPNGNNVSLAQQMSKLNKNQQDYNAALKAYSSLNALSHMVLGK